MPPQFSPTNIDIDPRDGTIFVINDAGNRIISLNSTTEQVQNTIYLFIDNTLKKSEPLYDYSRLKINPDKNELYLSNPRTNSFYFIDLQSGKMNQRVTLGSNPGQFSFTSAGLIYVLNPNLNDVSLINGTTHQLVLDSAYS